MHPTSLPCPLFPTLQDTFSISLSIGMGTKIRSFFGTDRIPNEVPSIDSPEVSFSTWMHLHVTSRVCQWEQRMQQGFCYTLLYTVHTENPRNLINKLQVLIYTGTNLQVPSIGTISIQMWKVPIPNWASSHPQKFELQSQTLPNPQYPACLYFFLTKNILIFRDGVNQL